MSNAVDSHCHVFDTRAFPYPRRRRLPAAAARGRDRGTARRRARCARHVARRAGQSDERLRLRQSLHGSRAARLRRPLQGHRARAARRRRRARCDGAARRRGDRSAHRPRRRWRRRAARIPRCRASRAGARDAAGWSRCNASGISSHDARARSCALRAFRWSSIIAAAPMPSAASTQPGFRALLEFGARGPRRQALRPVPLFQRRAADPAAEPFVAALIDAFTREALRLGVRLAVPARADAHGLRSRAREAQPLASRRSRSAAGTLGQRRRGCSASADAATVGGRHPDGQM